MPMPLRLPAGTLKAMVEHVHYELDRLTLWSSNGPPIPDRDVPSAKPGPS
jgi:hypothetical protein